MQYPVYNRACGEKHCNCRDDTCTQQNADSTLEITAGVLAGKTAQQYKKACKNHLQA